MSTTTAPKKGNKTTEIIIGSAASRMEAAVKSMLQVAPEVSKLQETISTSTLEVVNLEDKIGGLKQDYTNKVAQNKIEIEQAYAADQKGFVEKWLTANEMMVVKEEDYNELQSELKEATEKKDDAVNKAVGAATGSMKKDHENALKLSALEFEKKEAENAAKITQMAAQIKFLEEQVGHWKTMLESQQKNETERAKYGQIGTMNVGAPNSGR